MRYWIGITSAFVLLVFLAACGGGTPSATEQWAGSVCTPIDDWATQMKGYGDDIRSQLESPSAGTAANIQATVAKGAQATNQLAASLKGLGPPPSSNGATAKSLIDALATDVQQTVTSVQTEVKGLQENPGATELAASISTIAGEVSALIAQGQSTVESLQTLNGELKDSFDQADSCKQLKKDVG